MRWKSAKGVLVYSLYAPKRLSSVAHFFPPLKRRGALGHPGDRM